jgi:hypothetical protein
MASKKQKQVITGVIENENGELIAEDGGNVTPALQQIYEFDEKLKEESVSTEIVPREPTEITPLAGKQAIITNMFDVPKICDHCYLQDKCRFFKLNTECYYRVKITVDNAGDITSLMKMLIEKQGERVIFGHLIEQTEGGYIDRNLSDEMVRLMNMIKEFKDIISPAPDEISVKIKGKTAVESVSSDKGVLSDIFGSMGKK